jgi:hypothetical protein
MTASATLLQNLVRSQDEVVPDESRFDGWRSMSALLSGDVDLMAMGNTNVSCGCPPQTSGCGSSPVSPCGC